MDLMLHNSIKHVKCKALGKVGKGAVNELHKCTILEKVLPLGMQVEEVLGHDCPVYQRPCIIPASNNMYTFPASIPAATEPIIIFNKRQLTSTSPIQRIFRKYFIRATSVPSTVTGFISRQKECQRRLEYKEVANRKFAANL